MQKATQVEIKVKTFDWPIIGKDPSHLTLDSQLGVLSMPVAWAPSIGNRKKPKQTVVIKVFRNAYIRSNFCWEDLPSGDANLCQYL